MMAAASNGSPTRHLTVPTGDRLKAIEAKVVILGAQGVGKTSLVVRNMGGIFSESVSPTIGASFFSFSMIVAGFRVKLQVWDTAGQERFRSMAPMYYRRANAAIIVYDITNEKSFEEAKLWLNAISIVGNKTDLSIDKRIVSRERGVEFAHSLGAMFTETSAADNVGVKEAFLKVSQGVIELYQNHLLMSTTMSSSYTPMSGTTSPLPPRNPVNGLNNHVYVYQTHSIGTSSKVLGKNEEAEVEKKSSCCW